MSATRVSTFGIIILLFAAYSTDVNCVKIKNLQIPEYFTLTDDSPDHIVLDCEYELEEGETNLVVKWQHNGTTIYQWIYGTNATAFPHMKGKINESYEASSDELQRHRALVLLNPTKETTGHYKCLVSVEQSVDAKSGHLKILDFKNFSLEVNHITEEDDIHITCEAKNVYPRPLLHITLNKEDNLPITSQEMEIGEDGYYDASVTGTVSNDGIEADSIFGCSLTFDGINYTANRFVSFSGEDEQFSFLEQSKNNLPISGESSLHSSSTISCILVVFTAIVVPLILNGLIPI